MEKRSDCSHVLWNYILHSVICICVCLCVCLCGLSVCCVFTLGCRQTQSQASGYRCCWIWPLCTNMLTTSSLEELQSLAPGYAKDITLVYDQTTGGVAREKRQGTKSERKDILQSRCSAGGDVLGRSMSFLMILYFCPLFHPIPPVTFPEFQ